MFDPTEVQAAVGCPICKRFVKVRTCKNCKRKLLREQGFSDEQINNTGGQDDAPGVQLNLFEDSL